MSVDAQERSYEHLLTQVVQVPIFVRPGSALPRSASDALLVGAGAGRPHPAAAADPAVVLLKPLSQWLAGWLGRRRPPEAGAGER